MNTFVCGFLFSADRRQVLLIRKKGKRFTWMEGLLNGVGGLIEAGETPLIAMSREFEEETGLVVEPWQEFLYANLATAKVHFFRAFVKELTRPAKQTDELTDVYDIHKLNKAAQMKTITNLSWIVPLALETEVIHAEVFYK